jgi:uncharacterized membrane protein
MESDRLTTILGLLYDGLNALFSLMRSYFLTGVFIIVPVAVTLFIFFQVFQLADGLLGEEISRIMGFRLPGVGLIATAFLCILAGMIGQNVIGKRILRWVDLTLERLPVVRSLYMGVKQVSNVLFQGKRTDFKRVVLIEYPKSNSWVIGFVTNDFVVPLTGTNLPEKPLVTVFVPTTPNPTSGFLVVTENHRLLETSLDIETAMKIVISGGLVQAGMLDPASQLSLGTPTEEDFTIPH